MMKRTFLNIEMPEYIMVELYTIYGENLNHNHIIAYLLRREIERTAKEKQAEAEREDRHG